MAVDLGAVPRPAATAMQLPACRHLVVVAICADELLAAAGGFVQRVANSGARVDVLIVADEGPPGEPPGDPADDGTDEQAGIYEPVAIPGVGWHRLALRRPIRESGVTDLIGAISELIGFDPEPGVCCLAPAMPGLDPDRHAVGRAAALTADAYSAQLVRYLTGEPEDVNASVLELDELEWQRKRAALTARAAAGCAPAGGSAPEIKRCELFLD